MSLKCSEVPAGRICVEDMLIFAHIGSVEAELFLVTKVALVEGRIAITGFSGCEDPKTIHSDRDVIFTRIHEREIKCDIIGS